MEQADLLQRVLHWADTQPAIRAVLLTGSHAEGRQTDALSDYDLALFCVGTIPYVSSDGWLKGIASVWVSVPDQFSFLGLPIPTRLAIFDGGVKCDFAFYPLEVLEGLANALALPAEFDQGYRVLLDKDGLAENLPEPAFEGFRETKPSAGEFQDLIREFWFEAYHVAKYLQRQDLWSVQFRLSGMQHRCLIKMICWHEACRQGWNLAVSPIGKRLQEWVGEDTREALKAVFPRFQIAEGWRALRSLTALFSKLAHETAASLGYDCLPETERNLCGFIEGLERKS